jgi:hypothetical protein
MKLGIWFLLFGTSVMMSAGCSKDRSDRPRGSDWSSADNAAMASELQTVDDYLSKWDRFASGKNELVLFLKENKKSFEAALTRSLNAKDKRAPARMIFYPVVQVGGSIPVDSELGKAAATILGADFPVTTSNDGERNYFAGDLFFWWQDNGKKYEAYPLFEEWSKRDFAKSVVVPMYNSACKRK